MKEVGAAPISGRKLRPAASGCQRRCGVKLIFRRKPAREAAALAYRRVAEQARQPAFFTDYGVPDTLDGRFELICLHAFFYLHRLKSEGAAADRLGQEFFDAIFVDFDRALREIGVGDLSVGRQIKRMAQAFYGRVWAYQEGIASEDRVLAAALARNLFGTATADAPPLAAMTAYVRGAAAALRAQPTAELLAGRVRFEPPAAVARGGR